MARKVFNFEECLTASKDEEQQRVFDDYYFANLRGLKEVRFRPELHIQTKGIDKELYFQDGEKITVDEKYDSNEPKNLFIEVATNIDKEHYSEGWLYKNQCDYLVYGFTSGHVYWVPMKALRRVFERHQTDKGHEWILDYGPRFIENTGKHGHFTGMGIPVPVEVVMSECAESIFHIPLDRPPKWDVIEWLYSKDARLFEKGKRVRDYDRDR
jgi:hypothetical protein